VIEDDSDDMIDYRRRLVVVA